MSAPTLTFTPAMFHASKAGIKDITRRLAQVSRQNDIDQLAAAIADDDEMAFWKSHTHLCAHQPGQIKPMVTTWAVPSIYDTMKPSDIGAVLTPKFIWFNDGSKKPAWAGKSRPGRFLPMTLYDLAPQVEILTVHAEFLHAITAASALREGISQITKDDGRNWKYGLADRDGLPGTDDHGWQWDQWQPTAREAYLKLWDSINAARENGQYAAIKNPAVWVITYLLLS
jgi:hypothetical protein